MFHCYGCAMNQSKTLQRDTPTCYVHRFSGSGIRAVHHRTPHLCPKVRKASTGKFIQLELDQLRCLSPPASLCLSEVCAALHGEPRVNGFLPRRLRVPKTHLAWQCGGNPPPPHTGAVGRIPFNCCSHLPKTR